MLALEYRHQTSSTTSVVSLRLHETDLSDPTCVVHESLAGPYIPLPCAIHGLLPGRDICPLATKFCPLASLHQPTDPPLRLPTLVLLCTTQIRSPPARICVCSYLHAADFPICIHTLESTCWSATQ